MSNAGESHYRLTTIDRKLLLYIFLEGEGKKKKQHFLQATNWLCANLERHFTRQWFYFFLFFSPSFPCTFSLLVHLNNNSKTMLNGCLEHPLQDRHPVRWSASYQVAFLSAFNCLDIIFRMREIQRDVQLICICSLNLIPVRMEGSYCSNHSLSACFFLWPVTPRNCSG